LWSIKINSFQTVKITKVYFLAQILNSLNI
jgi:hypothetical protein